MHSWAACPYMTRKQLPLSTLQTLTLLSKDDEHMYWLFKDQSKSANDAATYNLVTKTKGQQNSK